MRTNLLFFILLFAVVNLNLTAQNAGDNDPTFNPTDIGFGFGDGANYSVQTTAIQSDGKVIIGGDFTTYNGTPRNHITRLNPNGNLDSSFIVGTGANNAVYSIAIQTNGQLIIGGGFFSYNGTPRRRIARLNSNGSLDTSFVVGTGANNPVYTTAIQTDGKIIIGGQFTTYNGISRNRIARLNTDGSLDSSFVVGTGTNSTVKKITIQTDGKIIISGEFTSYNGILRRRIARLNTDGSLDTSFVVATGSDNTILTTAIQTDGKIIIGGQFTSYNNIPRNRIARLNADGSLDASFVVGTGVTGLSWNTNTIETAVLQPNGKIVIGGLFTDYNGTALNNTARLNTDGSLDTSFVIGTGPSHRVYTTAIQTDGKIIIGGGFSYYNGFIKKNIVRLNTNGSIDTSFVVGTGANSYIFTSTIQPDGKIIIGGHFRSYNGIFTNCIARLNYDGSLDTTFVVETGVNASIISSAIQPDGKILIGGHFTSYDGIPMNRIARLNTDGSLDTSFVIGIGTDNYVQTITTQSDGKIIIGGGFTQYNGIPINRIARLNADGSLDNSFNVGTGANGSVDKILIQAGGEIIIGGSFNLYNGTPINQLARLNTNGSLDTSFVVGTGTNSSITTSELQADGKIVIVGFFTSYNGASRNYIARINTDGSLDTSFVVGTGANNPISTVAIQNDGKIIIGGSSFTSYNGIPINRIARLNTDGSLDTSFVVGNGPNSAVYTTAIQTDGKIIIGGFFTSYNGIGRNRIARLFNNCYSFRTDTQTTCDSLTWIDSVTYTSSTNTPSFTLLGGAANGCDSVVMLNLTVLNSATIDTQTACDSLTWIDGLTYTSSTTTPTFTLTNINGCDSVVTLNLTLNNSTSSTDIVVTCDSLTWIDGLTYTSSTTTPTFTLTNAAGCDSVVTLNLTIMNTASGIDTQTTCDSLTWIDNITYTSSTNTPTFTLVGGAVNGCDSIITLNLTILNTTTGVDTQVACDSLTWIDGLTYTSSTITPTFTLTNAAGCDSVVTLNLTILNSTTGVDTQVACDSLTWIDGLTYTLSTNTPTFTLTNAAGCDSVVTLNLTLLTSTTGVDTQIACDSLTWIDNVTYTSSTNTPTFTLTNAAGCDSLVTLNLTILNSTTSIDTQVACDSLTWIDNVTYTLSTNTPTINIVGGAANGCDSVVTLNLTINNLNASYTKVDNGGGNYTFTNTSTGSFTQTHWAFGDGNTSTLANPTHTFNANGTYVVVLTINDSTTKNTCMDYYLDTLVVTGVVNPTPCAAGFVMYPDGNNNVTVVNSSTGNNLTYFWDFGDGDTSTMQFPSHTYATAGPFYLCLTVNDGASCVDTYCDSIGINGVLFNKQTGFTINVIAPPVVVGVDEQGALITDVTIYPNPTTNEFVVELTNFSPSTQLSIISIEGKTVYSNSIINTNKLLIDASEWSRGIYVVKITDKQSSKVVKLIKQ